MDEQRLNYLFGRYQKDQLSEQEKTDWLEALTNPLHQQLIDELADGVFERKDLLKYQMEEGKANEVLESILQQSQFNKPKTYILWKRIAIAAALATIVVSTSIWFYKQNQNNTDQLAELGDIAPGRKGATLTLANGKTIRLTDVTNGVVAKEAGVSITKSADGQLVYEIKNNLDESNKINTLSTVNGETYKLRLPDGSLVWLNSASSLTYAANLMENGQRKVKLRGEGYFEIAKDKLHPFIVSTNKQDVEVLGTHFNINAYADEPVITTTLLEGSVKLTAGNKDKLLKPGEQAINDGGQINVGKANMEAIVDWKNEEFFLDKMDFRLAMRKIARWYDIEVIYNGSVPNNLEAGGWIPRNSKLSDVLKSIESSGLAHFKIDGRKLYVSK